MTGTNNSAFIFQLKQLGWKDNPEPVVINNTVNNKQDSKTRTDALDKLSDKELEELEKLYQKMDESQEKPTE